MGFLLKIKLKMWVMQLFFLSVSWGVRLNPVSKSSKFVCPDVNTGGGENSHLSSLRNAWGECIGVAGDVFSLSSKGFSCIPGDGIIGRKGTLSFRNTVLLFSISSSISSCILSMLYTFHSCQSFLWVPYKKDPG